MIEGNHSVNRELLDRIILIVRDLSRDPQVGRRATLYFTGLCLFLLTLNGLNVVNSYVGRDFMTAIADHNSAGFRWYALLYVLVFAALTFISVIHRWTEESLGLLWRKWLTWRIFRRYADHRVYWRMEEAGVVENPDQRIAEDIRAFTTTTLSFLLMLMNAGLTVIAFSGVLWTISPVLFGVAVAYAAIGTWLTYRLGRPMIRMNYDQLDREAEFRAALIHLRENADLVALSRREDLWIFRSGEYLENLASNFQKIIGINRNVGFFATGYNWMIQLIPALFVAPLFIDGKVEFGVITQAALAFTQLVGAFSLIITQFQSISSFTAVVYRLGLLTDTAIKAEQAEIAAAATATEHGQVSDRIEYRQVSLVSTQSGKPLVTALSAAFEAGQPAWVAGADEAPRDALFQATAGIRPCDGGVIIRPSLEQVMFVTERPYLCPGPLRELFLRPHPELVIDSGLCQLEQAALALPDEVIAGTLKSLGLGKLIQEFGGLDKSWDWDSLLSLADQQLLVIARALACRPRFVLLDRPGTSLSPDQVLEVRRLLARHDITAIIFVSAPADCDPKEPRLELNSGGKWRWRPRGRAA